MTTKTLQPLRKARYHYSTAIVRGKIYVAGGEVNRITSLTSVDSYDPVEVEDRWTEVANMNFRRSQFAFVEASGVL